MYSNEIPRVNTSSRVCLVHGALPSVLTPVVQSRQEKSPPAWRRLLAKSLGCVKNQGPSHGLEKLEHCSEDGVKGE